MRMILTLYDNDVDNFCLHSQAPEVLNNTSFRELLAYQRGVKHKEKDIECPNTAIRNIKARAKVIEEKLAEQMKVRTTTQI